MLHRWLPEICCLKLELLNHQKQKGLVGMDVRLKPLGSYMFLLSLQLMVHKFSEHNGGLIWNKTIDLSIRFRMQQVGARQNSEASTMVKLCKISHVHTIFGGIPNLKTHRMGMPLRLSKSSNVGFWSICQVPYGGISWKAKMSSMGLSQDLWPPIPNRNG